MRRYLVCLALVLLPAAAPGAGHRLAAAAPGPVFVPASLTLRQALRLSLGANKAINLADLDTAAAAAQLTSTRGAFDAELFAETSRSRDDTPVAGEPLEHGDSSAGVLTAGVRKRFVTGTEIEMGTVLGESRDRTGANSLNPERGTAVFAEVRQDVLRDAGVFANRADIVIAENHAKGARAALEAVMIDRLFAVERAYWELYFGLADLRVREQRLANAERLVQRAEARVDVGEAAPIEVTRAEASAASQAVAITNTRNEVARLRHRLLEAMGALDRTSADTVVVPADTPADAGEVPHLQTVLETALERRPDWEAIRFEISNAAVRRRLAANAKLPSVELYGRLTRDGLDNEYRDSIRSLRHDDLESWEVGLAVAWPWPNRAARGRYGVAMVEEWQVAIRKEALRERITREVADALADLRATAARIETGRTARTLSRRLLEAEEISFNLGRSDSLDVLTAQAALAEAERDEVRARTDCAVAAANLLRVQGTYLDRHGIAVQDTSWTLESHRE